RFVVFSSSSSRCSISKIGRSSLGMSEVTYHSGPAMLTRPFCGVYFLAEIGLQSHLKGRSYWSTVSPADHLIRLNTFGIRFRAAVRRSDGAAPRRAAKGCTRSAEADAAAPARADHGSGTAGHS